MKTAASMFGAFCLLGSLAHGGSVIGRPCDFQISKLTAGTGGVRAARRAQSFIKALRAAEIRMGQPLYSQNALREKLAVVSQNQRSLAEAVNELNHLPPYPNGFSVATWRDSLTGLFKALHYIYKTEFDIERTLGVLAADVHLQKEMIFYLSIFHSRTGDLSLFPLLPWRLKDMAEGSRSFEESAEKLVRNYVLQELNKNDVPGTTVEYVGLLRSPDEKKVFGLTGSNENSLRPLMSFYLAVPSGSETNYYAILLEPTFDETAPGLPPLDFHRLRNLKMINIKPMLWRPQIGDGIQTSPADLPKTVLRLESRSASPRVFSFFPEKVILKRLPIFEPTDAAAVKDQFLKDFAAALKSRGDLPLVDSLVVQFVDSFDRYLSADLRLTRSDVRVGSQTFEGVFGEGLLTRTLVQMTYDTLNNNGRVTIKKQIRVPSGWKDLKSQWGSFK